VNDDDRDERRGSTRFETRIGGKLASSRGSRHAIEITDLSIGGFNMALEQRTVTAKAGYAVRFAGLETLGAELCWATGDEAGFRFERPLHPAVVDHVVRAHPAAINDAGDSEAEPHEPEREV
jgi:hypothetical protein